MILVFDSKVIRDKKNVNLIAQMKVLSEAESIYFYL